MPNGHQFEVFKGSPNQKIIRLGAVKDCQRAMDLMYRMYARLPGDYFIRNASTMETVSSVQSTGKSFGPTHFDIFRGLPDRNAVWVETVEGLSDARGRMEEIAITTSGTYFLFSRIDHSILGYAEGAAIDKPQADSQPGTAA